MYPLFPEKGQRRSGSFPISVLHLNHHQEQISKIESMGKLPLLVCPFL